MSQGEFEAAPAKTEGARDLLTQGRRNPAERTTLARAISSAWADQFRVTYRSAANAGFITHRAFERLQNWLTTEDVPSEDCVSGAWSLPDSSQTCITRNQETREDR